MEYIKVYADEDLRAALHVAAEAKGISDAELARRLLARGLAIDGSDAQAEVLANAVRHVIRHELAPTRHYGFLAAREAAASHRYNIALLTVILQQLLKMPSTMIDRTLEQADSLTMRYAAQHLQDVEPDDPALDAPAEPLPGPADEVTVEDGDTASMIEGA